MTAVQIQKLHDMGENKKKEKIKGIKKKKKKAVWFFSVIVYYFAFWQMKKVIFFEFKMFW